MRATSAIDEVTITAQGYEQVRSEPQARRTRRAAPFALPTRSSQRSRRGAMPHDTRTVGRLQVYWTFAEINEMLADIGEPPTTLEELERAGVDVCPDPDGS